MPRTVFTSVLFLALMQFEPLPGQNFESIAKRIARSVVKVTAFDQGRAITAGNGFFVASDGFVVTDRQVIGDYKTIVIETADGIKHTGISVEASDAVHGLVLLRIADVSGPALALGSPRPGERVAVIALAKPIAAGLISDVMWAPAASRTEILPLRPTALVSTPGTELIQMTALVSASGSGSPVIDNSGEVVGSATYRTGLGKNVNFAISSKHVKELLDSHGLSPASIAWTKF